MQKKIDQIKQIIMQRKGWEKISPFEELIIKETMQAYDAIDRFYRVEPDNKRRDVFRLLFFIAGIGLGLLIMSFAN
jgi:hypothetical protein